MSTKSFVVVEWDLERRLRRRASTTDELFCLRIVDYYSAVKANAAEEVPDILIGPLRDETEARVCAALMAQSEPWLTLKRDFQHALALLLEDGKEIYVARAGTTLVGHIVVNMQGPFAGYIQAIAVAAGWRNLGIGARLIGFAEKRIFRESPNVFLCVSSFNPRAEQFYSRLGYERIGELKNYVISGASEILMRKSVGSKSEFHPLS